MLSPRQLFDDTMRPAELLLRVYRLLEHESTQYHDSLLQALRSVVGAHKDEDLILIYNEIFLGLIRERAQMPQSALKQSALCNLLRQAIVVSCTALETYLPALLRQNLPVVMRVKGRDFFPRDAELQEYFKNLSFGLSEVLRILEHEDATLYIANKMLGFVDYRYLSSTKGVRTVALLLSIKDPWEQIAQKLQRASDELMRIVDDTTNRRNDIVHRADRQKAGGEVQEISYSWTKQAADTISHVCLALDELTVAKMGRS